MVKEKDVESYLISFDELEIKLSIGKIVGLVPRQDPMLELLIKKEVKPNSSHA